MRNLKMLLFCGLIASSLACTVQGSRRAIVLNRDLAKSDLEYFEARAANPKQPSEVAVFSLPALLPLVSRSYQSFSRKSEAEVGGESSVHVHAQSQTSFLIWGFMKQEHGSWGDRGELESWGCHYRLLWGLLLETERAQVTSAATGEEVRDGWDVELLFGFFGLGKTQSGWHGRLLWIPWG